MPNNSFIGEIQPSAISFYPQGTAYCNGQLLPISQNDALYSLIGTTFGGDGFETFALPDLRGRIPIGQGNGPGLTPRVIGETGGSETLTLTGADLPPHIHSYTPRAYSGGGGVVNPGNNYPSADGGGVTQKYVSAGADQTMAAQQTGSAGTAFPLQILQPFTALNYYIFLEGIFPSRP